RVVSSCRFALSPCCFALLSRLVVSPGRGSAAVLLLSSLLFPSLLVTMPSLPQSQLRGYPLAPEAVLTLANKGRGLYQDLVRRLQHLRPDPALPGLDPNYDLDPSPPEGATVGGGVDVAIGDAGHPLAGYPNPKQVVRPPRRSRPMSPARRFTRTMPIPGAKLCMSNEAGRDIIFRQGGAGRLFMSDALAESGAWVARVHGADWRGLEAIWRLIFDNERTQRLIVAVCGGRTDPQEFPAGDDRLFALLGSEHGKAPCRMLATYPDMFGRKALSRVGMFPDGGPRDRPSLCWFLEEAPPPPPPPPPTRGALAPPATPDRPLSRKEARQYKRSLSSHASSASPVTPVTPTRPSRRSHARNLSAPQ
ncbi:hypothetical protein B0I37DRAFT_435651, partial [Chaetomium sp. MPI-CAGE-AT-0009]